MSLLSRDKSQETRDKSQETMRNSQKRIARQRITINEPLKPQ
jgi:hypothetical protein